jgi:hypothetical protein
MFDKDTWLTVATIFGTVAVVVGFALAIYSPPTTPRNKHLAFLIAIVLVLVPCAAYLYSTYSSQLGGDFEWQWAGQNWMGSIDIAREKHETVAKVDLKAIHKELQPDGTFTYRHQQVFKFTKGSVEGDRNGFRLSVPLVKVDTGEKLMLDAELRRVEAYVGIARYTIGSSTEYNGGTGDIILVRHRSQARVW